MLSRNISLALLLCVLSPLAALAQPAPLPLATTTPQPLSDGVFLSLAVRNCAEAIALAKAARRAGNPALATLSLQIETEQQAALANLHALAKDYDLDLPAHAAPGTSPGVAALRLSDTAQLSTLYLSLARSNQAAALQLLRQAAALPELSADMRRAANNLIGMVWAHSHALQALDSRVEPATEAVSLRM